MDHSIGSPSGGITRSVGGHATGPSLAQEASLAYSVPALDFSSGDAGHVSATNRDAESQAVQSIDTESAFQTAALTERIDRVIDYWLEAEAPSPGIRLSHYAEILRGGTIADSLAATADDGGKSSYADGWRRLRPLLDQRTGLHGGVSIAEFGSQLVSSGDGAGGLDESSDVAARLGVRAASVRTPLPMFSGLRDGFDRL